MVNVSSVMYAANRSYSGAIWPDTFTSIVEQNLIVAIFVARVTLDILIWSLIKDFTTRRNLLVARIAAKDFVKEVT